MVWYVNNTASSGDGRSSSPFSTLAAAQTLHWTELVRHAEAHLARCLALRDAYAGARVSADAPCVLVGLGSDLGLYMQGARAAISALRTPSGDHVHSVSSGTQGY